MAGPKSRPNAKHKTESEIWITLSAWARENLFTAIRLEDSVQPGIPDVYLGMGSRARMWVELKAGYVGFSSFRKGQLSWAYRNAGLGETAITLSVVKAGIVHVWRTTEIAEARLADRMFPKPLVSHPTVEGAMECAVPLLI